MQVTFAYIYCEGEMAKVRISEPPKSPPKNPPVFIDKKTNFQDKDITGVPAVEKTHWTEKPGGCRHAHAQGCRTWVWITF